MKATIESTEQIVEIVHGYPNEIHSQARVWIGTTENGVPVQLLIFRVAVHKDQPPEVFTQFERELQEQPVLPAPDVRAFPLRMIL